MSRRFASLVLSLDISHRRDSGIPILRISATKAGTTAIARIIRQLSIWTTLLISLWNSAKEMGPDTAIPVHPKKTTSEVYFPLFDFGDISPINVVTIAISE